ncbi:MAG: hypothetical protein KGQ88_08790, partial [Chloroflexi bacterium]|nr:hypothetical protein [Chloroflexota bacterium]
MGAVVLALLLVVYVGISYRYADTLSLVKRHAIEKPATLVAPTHEDVGFTTADGLTLKGWWFTAPRFRDRAVVFVHGKDQDRIDSSFDPAPNAKLLLFDGYDVLLFDLRGHGESQGLRWGLGGPRRSTSPRPWTSRPRRRTWRARASPSSASRWARAARSWPCGTSPTSGRWC